MSMRIGVLVIVIVCILLSISTLIPTGCQSSVVGLLTLGLALTMIYCLGSRWRYQRGNLTARQGAYVLIHIGFIMLVLAGLVGMRGEDFTLELREQQEVDLSPYHHPLQVRADEIRAEYYPSGLPRQYFTTLSFLDGGKSINIQTTSVNHPVSFQGLYFYQSAYSNDHGKVSILKVKTKPERPYLWVGILFLGAGVFLWLFKKGRLA